MISLKEFKKSLGVTAKSLSEEEILKLREQQDQMAEVFFSMWLNDIKTKKNEVQ
jgi:hypothetical protein